jgi:hypothetical protein
MYQLQLDHPEGEASHIQLQQPCHWLQRDARGIAQHSLSTPAAKQP